MEFNVNFLMSQKTTKTNIVLIGMAGAGKSSVGKKLAELLGRPFVDIDTLIEEDQNLPLQEVLNTLGVQEFRKVEEKVLLSFGRSYHIVATGGSAIYSQSGIDHLHTTGLLILLDVGLPILKERVGDFSNRGLVKTVEQTFDEVFEERKPLYSKNADLTIDCQNRSIFDISKLIVDQVADTFYHL